MVIYYTVVMATWGIFFFNEQSQVKFEFKFKTEILIIS